MPIQSDIPIDELIRIVNKLCDPQLSKLKAAIEKKSKLRAKKNSLEAFLLEAPTFSKHQLQNIAKTKKAINQWRTS